MSYKRASCERLSTSFRILNDGGELYIQEPPFDGENLFFYSCERIQEDDRLFIDWTETDDSETFRPDGAWRDVTVTDRDVTIDSARVERGGVIIQVHEKDLSEIMDMWHHWREKT
jgi:hypothetical protein